MSRRAALRVVEPQVSHTGGVELIPSADGAHSLHYSLQLRGVMPPEVATYFIRRYSKAGETVLDMTCRDGSVALEAALQGRICNAVCADTLGAKITRSKVAPADITEVTLWLQKVNLKRPVDLIQYTEIFSPFFDVNTFREIINLRRYIDEFPDRISRFVEITTASILHGHSAGYLSVYTFPQVSISPSEQRQLNAKRHHTPDYRAVLPRILRKSAALLRDGIPSVLYPAVSQGRVVGGELGRANLSLLSGNSLALATLNTAGIKNLYHDMWLKLWFLGLGDSDLTRCVDQADGSTDLVKDLSAIFSSAARTVRAGGRLVVYAPSARGRISSKYEVFDSVRNVVEASYSHIFDIEGVFINPQKAIKLGESTFEGDTNAAGDYAVVLRHR